MIGIIVVVELLLGESKLYCAPQNGEVGYVTELMKAMKKSGIIIIMEMKEQFTGMERR